MAQIIPTLFSKNEEEFKLRIQRVQESESFKDGAWVQYDLMDGKFVPTTGISLEVIKKYPLENYQKEAQLIVADPKEWIDGLVDYGVERIIFPLEIEHDINELIEYISRKGIEVGISINPETEVKELEKYAKDLDAILLMSVKPGLERQEFAESTIEKVKFIREQKWIVAIGVDGGIKDSNVKALVDAGVDYLAIGSFLFEGDIDENVERIWEAIQG